MPFSCSLWLVSLMLGVVYAQQPTTTATCGSDFDWMSNDRNQSPCLIAAYLQGACGSGAWTVPQLPFSTSGAQQAYLPPNATTANMCTCSSATYNLMSACAACQGGGYLLFAPWSIDCATRQMLSIPESFPASIPVPSNTTVPGYALVDPRAWNGGGFNITEARGVALGAVPPSLTSSTSPSGTPSSATWSSSSSSTTAEVGPSARQDDTGVIVGGVVGGILGILLIFVLMLWLLCGKRLQHRSASHDRPSSGQGILGRAFRTPTEPPMLTNLAVPIPVRPYPLKNGFQSHISASTTGSNAGDHYNPGRQMVSPKTTTEGHGSNRTGQLSRLEGGGVQFSQEPTILRSNTTSSSAQALFRRVTSSFRWHRRGTTISSTSLGSGTAMTSFPADSDIGHGSHNVSRQTTTRRIPEPTPFIIPDHPGDVPMLDISARAPVAGQEADYSQYYGMSASDEKRRLNPPVYVAPPMIPSNVNPASTQMPESMAPNHSASFLDIISGAATTGSRSNDDHGKMPSSAHPHELQSASRYRPDSNPMSIPSNLMLSSPQDLRSQDASSGMLDASPLVTKNSPSNLRFVVANPSRDVEM